MREIVHDGPHPRYREGTQRVYRFDNGYGASVVRNRMSYGGDEGLFELAVVRWPAGSDTYEIVYDTPVTDDVLGWLNVEQVERVLDDIEALDTESLL